jgi:hypothetical protein
VPAAMETRVVSPLAPVSRFGEKRPHKVMSRLTASAARASWRRLEALRGAAGPGLCARCQQRVTVILSYRSNALRP